MEPGLSMSGRGTLVSEVQLIVPEFFIFQYLMNLVSGSRRVPSGRFSSRNKAAIVGTKDVCETPGPLVSSVQSIVEKKPWFLIKRISFDFSMNQKKKAGPPVFFVSAQKKTFCFRKSMKQQQQQFSH